MKNEQYWAEIHDIVLEIQRLSTDVQGPLIEEHLDHITDSDMDVAEITAYIEQFYTDEDREAWLTLDIRGTRIAQEHDVSVDDVKFDIMTFAAGQAGHSPDAH